MAANQYRLLLVDGEAALEPDVQELLAGEFEVSRVVGADAALKALSRRPGHVALVFGQADDRAAVNLLAQMQELAPDCQRVLVVASRDPQIILDAINRAGVCRCLAAPCEGGQLLDALRAAAERHDQELDLHRQLAELHYANEVKRIFAELASLELMTPTTLVSTLAELIGTTPRESLAKDLDWYRGDLWQECQRLTTSVQELAQFVATEQFDVRLSQRPCALAPIVRRATEAVLPIAAGRKQSIRCVTPGEEMEVWVDAWKIRDALVQLLLNAIKFSPDGSETQVVLALEEDGSPLISVIDRGPGLSPEELEHLFDPVFATEQPIVCVTGYLKPLTRGLGLGLKIARDFLGLHGGRISAESQLGAGSTFRIHLPAGLRSSNA